jgi:hypothetical protein
VAGRRPARSRPTSPNEHVCLDGLGEFLAEAVTFPLAASFKDYPIGRGAVPPAGRAAPTLILNRAALYSGVPIG